MTLSGRFFDLDDPKVIPGDSTHVFATENLGRDWLGWLLIRIPVAVLCGGALYGLRRLFAKPSY